MSRYLSITCDTPGCDHWHDTFDTHTEHAENDAHNQGWTLGPPDHCPDHAKPELTLIEAS